MSIQEYFEKLADDLDVEVAAKVKEGITLFYQCHPKFRSVVIERTGFSGTVTPEALAEHFDTIDLWDGLDEAMVNMRLHIKEEGVYDDEISFRSH